MCLHVQYMYMPLFYSDCKRKTPTRQAQNEESARRLWDICADYVKLQPDEIHQALQPKTESWYPPCVTTKNWSSSTKHNILEFQYVSGRSETRGWCKNLK